MAAQQWMKVPQTAIEDLYWLARGESPMTDRAEGLAMAAQWLLSGPSFESALAELPAAWHARDAQAAGAAAVLNWVMSGEDPPLRVPHRGPDGQLLDAEAIAQAMAGPAADLWEPEQWSAARIRAATEARRSREMAARIDEIRARAEE
jgi:hypothetical protein